MKLNQCRLASKIPEQQLATEKSTKLGQGLWLILVCWSGCVGGWCAVLASARCANVCVWWWGWWWWWWCYCYKLSYIGNHRISILLLGSDEVSSHNHLAWHLWFWREPQPIVLCQYFLHHIETRQIQYYIQAPKQKVSILCNHSNHGFYELYVFVWIKNYVHCFYVQFYPFFRYYFNYANLIFTAK